MKVSNLKKQQGAVLAFSLMILLLLTLASVSMIQQNKQQLEMANSVRIFTQEFANAERLLEAAKSVINSAAAHVDPSGSAINDPAHKCVPSPDTPMLDRKQMIGLAGPVTGVSVPSGSSVTILSVRCKSFDNLRVQVCSSYNGTSTSCYPDSHLNKHTTPHPIPCTTVSDALTAATPTDICYQHYLSTPTDGGECPSEIYTIEVLSTDAKSDVPRKIISDHVVGCGA